MKIAHLISNYFPSIGGAQAFIHHMAKKTIEKGHVPVVLTPARRGGDDSAFKYEILRLNPLLNRFLFINFPLGKIYLERVLTGIQKRYNFDIWQVTFGYPLGAAAADFFNKNGIPCILRCTGEDIQTLPEIEYGYRLNKAVEKKIRENYKKFSAIITAESIEKEFLSLGVPRNKMFRIPNGVDCAKFKDTDEGNVRNELGIGNQKLILTIGRNHPKKNFKSIPYMIKKLVGKIDFKWLLVGKGCENVKSLAEKEGVGKYLIVREANPNISDGGEPEVPNRELIQYYKASDVFVFPTFIELFAKVLIEAMAAGLPIVTTDVPGSTDIIKDNENGLKVKTDDIEAFVESILRLFSDRELSQKLSKNSLRKSKNYDWNEIANRYLELYHQVIGSK